MTRLKKEETGNAKVGDNGLDPGDEASQSRIYKNLIRHKIELDRVQSLTHAVYTGKTIIRKNVQGRIDMPEKAMAGRVISILMSFTAEEMSIHRGMLLSLVD